jgi:uncharacterized membrane protein
MSDQPPAPPNAREHRLTGVLYMLDLIGVLTLGATTLVALIVNYVKRGALGHDLYRHHFDWQIRSSWWFLGCVVAVVALIAVSEKGELPAAGIAAGVLWLGGALWYIYRTLRGFMWLTWSERVQPRRSKRAQ